MTQNETTQAAVDVMNKFYKKCNIVWELIKVNQINSTDCKNIRVDDIHRTTQFKESTHEGNASTLNLNAMPTNEGNGVKGMCNVYRENITNTVGRADGCTVAMETFHKNSVDKNSVDDITVSHEAGHWLGENHNPGKDNIMTPSSRYILICRPLS